MKRRGYCIAINVRITQFSIFKTEKEPVNVKFVVLFSIYSILEISYYFVVLCTINPLNQPCEHMA